MVTLLERVLTVHSLYSNVWRQTPPRGVGKTLYTTCPGLLPDSEMAGSGLLNL